MLPRTLLDGMRSSGYVSCVRLHGAAVAFLLPLKWGHKTSQLLVVRVKGPQ